jgi:hypothetical protein
MLLCLARQLACTLLANAGNKEREREGDARAKEKNDTPKVAPIVTRRLLVQAIGYEPWGKHKENKRIPLIKRFYDKQLQNQKVTIEEAVIEATHNSVRL